MADNTSRIVHAIIGAQLKGPDMSLQTWEETAESRESRAAAESASFTERAVQVCIALVGCAMAFDQIVMPVWRAGCYFFGG